ncbi:MAG TPA: flagellar biosynthesis anti-sigma factor FlgM [Bryocella sp.]|nr:flagellar biosynthesis anti-sigma factor FlgM [Bryocella sp.]
MVDVTTLEAIALQLPANDTVSDTILQPWNEARNKDSRNQAQRRERIVLLREAIERGEYSVPASELAGAILRTARRAN